MATTFERVKKVIVSASIQGLDLNNVRPTTVWTDLTNDQTEELELIYALDEEFSQEFPTHLPIHAWGKGHTLQQMAEIIDREIEGSLQPKAGLL